MSTHFIGSSHRRHRTSWTALGVVLTLVLTFSFAGCATTGETDASRRNSNVLTRDEIVQTEAGNLYDAVQQLRPRWLNVRGGSRSFGLDTEVVVFQGQTMLGGVDVLRQLPVGTAQRLRFLDSTTASASLPGLGSRHVAGAIVIETAVVR